MSEARDFGSVGLLVACVCLMVGMLTAPDLFGVLICGVGLVIFGTLAAYRVIVQGHRWRSQSGRGTNLSAGRADKTSTSDGATTLQLPQAIQPTPPGPQSGRQP